MAQFDFPASPSLGDVFTDPSGASYNWNGYAWMGGAANSLGALIVSDTPPSAPANNSLWFESDTGMLFLRYNDGNSSQWVQVNALPNGAGYMPLRGVSDGSDAPAGQIGEVIFTGNAAGVPLTTTGVVYTIGTIALTPGDWDIYGEIWIIPTTGGNTTFGGVINTVSATIPASGLLNVSRFQMSSPGGFSNSFLIVPACRASLSTLTTYYLGAHCTFTTGTVTAGGKIWARRAR